MPCIVDGAEEFSFGRLGKDADTSLRVRKILRTQITRGKMMDVEQYIYNIYIYFFFFFRGGGI